MTCIMLSEIGRKEDVNAVHKMKKATLFFRVAVVVWGEPHYTITNLLSLLLIFPLKYNVGKGYKGKIGKVK